MKQKTDKMTKRSQMREHFKISFFIFTKDNQTS